MLRSLQPIKLRFLQPIMLHFFQPFFYCLFFFLSPLFEIKLLPSTSEKNEKKIEVLKTLTLNFKAIYKKMFNDPSNG